MRELLLLTLFVSFSIVKSEQFSVFVKSHIGESFWGTCENLPYNSAWKLDKKNNGPTPCFSVNQSDNYACSVSYEDLNNIDCCSIVNKCKELNGSWRDSTGAGVVGCKKIC